MPGWFRCPSLVVTGLYCPGCGSTRATHRLLNADIAGAFRYNPALIPLGVPALIGTAWACARTLRDDPRPLLRDSSRLAWTLLFVVISYAVARNLPWELFAALRPPV